MLNLLHRYGDRHGLRFALPDRYQFGYPRLFQASRVKGYRPQGGVGTQTPFHILCHHMRFNLKEVRGALGEGDAGLGGVLGFTHKLDMRAQRWNLLRCPFPRSLGEPEFSPSPFLSLSLTNLFSGVNPLPTQTPALTLLPAGVPSMWCHYQGTCSLAASCLPLPLLTVPAAF